MIAADVALIDLEPDGFSRICSLASRSQALPEWTVSVLHDAGKVVLAHDSIGADVDRRAYASFEDPGRRAAELRALTGAERVVLYDRTRIDDLARDLVAIAHPQTTQLDAFWANHAAFWGSDAIAVDPAPPRDPWSSLAVRLAPLGDDWWALLGLYEGDVCVATLLGHVASGVVDVVTSLDHLGAGIERPERARADRLLEFVAPLGRLELVLVCDLADFAEALLAIDTPSALAGLAESGRAIVSRNLHLLRDSP